MEYLHPTNGSSFFINIILPTELHYHYPTNGSSTLSYKWIFIILPMDHRYYIIILPSDLHYHYPTNGSSLSLSYQWIINIILPMDQHCPIDRSSSSSSSSYRRIFIIIIISMNLHQYYPINGSLSIIILSMEHYYPIDEVASSSYQWINITLPMDHRHPIN
ncbi:hypothetical protein KY285_024849 [Solanum tuberosum]|nr:hypothetical protein KY289_025060 [Solanum tuberosum]KAH0677048.1 hypothetical protein KY285_024849 [Solanum tuberosum]